MEKEEKQKNSKFNSKLQELREHISKNGEVNFIFIALSTLSLEAQKEIFENIRSFKK